MKLSVALATYKGGRHLAEQLESIRTQSRPPCELVVSDDASTDETLNIAIRFAATAPFPVHIQANRTNRGSTRSFAEAIGRCSGDVVVLADQDDVWLPWKLEAIEHAMRLEPDAAFAFSDAAIVDENLNALGYRLWDAIQFGTSEQRRFRDGFAFESLLRRYLVTGATMAFRTSLRDRILPIPEGWVHDAWIALILSATAPSIAIDEPLIRYRQHKSQQVGGRRRGLLAQYRAAKNLTAISCAAVAERYEEVQTRLLELGDVPEKHLSMVEAKIEHHRRRAELREAGTWRLPRVFREAVRGRYSRFGLGWKAIAQDLLMR